MKVLVTGGSGFIGSHIVDVLIGKGHSVINIDLNHPHRNDMTYIYGSILDKKLLDDIVQKCDAIYHLGGFSNIDFVKDNPVETIELNILSTVYLLDVCRKKLKPPHFIYASSVYAFDRHGHLYTTSKFLSEKIIEDFYLLYKVPYTILRFATVYGARSRKADVIYCFVENAINKGKIEIHGDGKQTRNFTNARDIGEGSVEVLERKNCLNKTLIIACPVSIAINELAMKVKEIVNPSLSINYMPSSRVADYGGTINGLEESFDLLGWRPRITLEEGIKQLKDIVIES